MPRNVRSAPFSHLVVALEPRHCNQGSHRSQDLTAERGLVNAYTSIHPDLLNSRFGYVSIFRANHEATLFTDISKTSALEIDQTQSSAQEIGIDMNL